MSVGWALPLHSSLTDVFVYDRGLGVLRIVSALIQVHCDPGNLVLVISTLHDEQVSDLVGSFVFHFFNEALPITS